MSKIGKININIPDKVKVALNGNNVNIEGPLGKKTLNIDVNIFDLNISEGKEISIKPKHVNDEKKPSIEINLKNNSGNPVINSIERVSKPGRRIFSSASSLPKINNGLGIAIVSTPQGVMTDVDARKKKLGGEIICKVF